MYAGNLQIHILYYLLHEYTSLWEEIINFKKWLKKYHRKSFQSFLFSLLYYFKSQEDTFVCEKQADVHSIMIL